MSGLMARIRRRRAEQASTPEPTGPLPPLEVEQPTLVAPAPSAPVDGGLETVAPADAELVLPAGADLASTASPERPGFRERGRLRRRLRYLRRLRELGFRDLGGLVFDLDRFGRDRGDLVRAKLDALAAVDAELRELEVALDDVQVVHELHEPGVAGCSRCGALHGSDARFCPSCGLDLRGGTPQTPRPEAPTTGDAFAAGASIAAGNTGSNV